MPERLRRRVFSTFTVDPLVQNGDAYESVSLCIPDDVRRIVVPLGTTVVTSEDDTLKIFLKKSLMYAGHPGEPTSILQERYKMGSAIRVRGCDLQIALYGAWSSFEGGSDISAVVVAPKRLEVLSRASLCLALQTKRRKQKPLQSKTGSSFRQHWFLVTALTA